MKVYATFGSVSVKVERSNLIIIYVIQQHPSLLASGQDMGSRAAYNIDERR